MKMKTYFKKGESMATETNIDKEIEDRIIRIKMIDGSRINGQVNIRRGSGYLM